MQNTNTNLEIIDKIYSLVKCIDISEINQERIQRDLEDLKIAEKQIFRIEMGGFLPLSERKAPLLKPVAITPMRKFNWDAEEETDPDIISLIDLFDNNDQRD